MERNTEFNLDLAINRYVSRVNSASSLTKEDEEELADHLLSEVENLEEAGLSTEEAFLIGQKRLGGIEMISQEYRKAKPWSRVLQLMASAMLFLLTFKMIFNIIKIFSLSTITAITQTVPLEIEKHMDWVDLWLQIIGLIGLLCLAVFFMKKWKGKNLRFFWPLPLLYVGTEAVLRFVYFVAMDGGIFEASLIGVHHLNHAYIYFTCVLLTVVASMWIILKNKEQRIQLA